MNLCIVCGARPNFIKVAPLLRAMRCAADPSGTVTLNSQLLYTGSASDHDLEPSLFHDLGIDPPDVCLGITATNLSDITGQVMQAFEEYLQTHPTDTVVVVDDLASTMAVAIVTKKHGIRLAHIAAGTRSFDISMPKEVNRLVIDGLSDILFTAGASNNSIANREGAELSKVYLVGNILIDNLRYLSEVKKLRSKVQSSKSKVQSYLVFTLNRKKLIADKDNLKKMVDAVLSSCGDLTVIAPLRKDAADAVSCCLNDESRLKFHVTGPMSYLEFETIAANAAGIITDSGNVAEEATFNHVPCVTLNSYTEHIETVTIGTNVLIGENPDKLAHCVIDIAQHKWKQGQLPDMWDGRTAQRILNILKDIS